MFVPPYPLVSIHMVIFPSPPEGICPGKETRGAAQPALIRLRVRTAVPVFFMTKS